MVYTKAEASVVVLNNSDIVTDSVGNRLFLMHKMTIANEKGDSKEYNQSDYLISKAYIEGTKIMLKRVNKDASHSPASDDSIVNLKENNKIGNKVSYVSVSSDLLDKSNKNVSYKNLSTYGTFHATPSRYIGAFREPLFSVSGQ